MKHKDDPIGVFDSGAGGISILKVLRKELPNEDFIYYGDDANAPYGEKSDSEILRLSENCLSFLLSHGVKACVIACNTATSAAANLLRAKYKDLIIVGMEPAVKPAVSERTLNNIENPEKAADSGPIVLVMATPSTLSGERFRHLVEVHEKQARILKLECPGIVRLVEAGKDDSVEMKEYLKDILEPYRLKKNGQIRNHVDSIVLGCTHFLFVRQQIREALGYSVTFFDGASGTARQTKRRLEAEKLLSCRNTEGRAELYTSSKSPETLALLNRLMRRHVYMSH